MKDIFTIKFNEALKQTDITQTKLANQIGISKQCISDFKSGKSFPSIQTLRLICHFLDVSADYLLGLEDESGAKIYINFQNSTNHGNFNF